MKKALPWVLLTLAAAGAAYWAYTHFKKISTKDEALKELYKANAARKGHGIDTFGEDFLIAWAQGEKDKQESFTLGGKTYSTETAKAI